MLFFFFKQKTAYEMRISDWSSDVCSSDLLGALPHEAGDTGGVADHVPAVVVELAADEEVAGEHLLLDDDLLAALEVDDVLHRDDDLVDAQIGRASCRERVCQSV